MAAPTMATGVFSTTTFNALAEYVDDTRTGIIIARGRRTTSSTASTGTEVGVIRLDDIPVTGGLLYRVASNGLHFDTTVAADVSVARVRYTTDGSTPSTASTILPGALAYALQGNASWPETALIDTFYAPAADETLSLLLTVNRVAGSGSCLIFADTDHTIDLWVESLGTDPGDTGTDI